jgi:hypothetical protein
MSIPRYDDVRDESLESDQKLLERTQLLLEHALRRQVWLMFLDDEEHQLPLVMPSYVPRSPGARDAARFAQFLRQVVEQCDATSIVITLERPGHDGVSEVDGEWFRLIAKACAIAELPLRGPMLCHDRGVRWIAHEDYALG